MTACERERLRARLELVRWAAGLGAVTDEALALRTGGGVRSARARLLAAERSGLLRRLSSLHGRPCLFTVTRAGLRACGLPPLRPVAVGAAGAEHAIACAAAAAWLERCFPDQLVTGEVWLRRREHADGERSARCDAAVPLAPGRAPGARHRPDLLLSPAAGTPGVAAVAVEVELTVKAPRRLQSICLAWARARHVAGVLYIVSEAVRGPLERAIARCSGDDRILVVPLAEISAATTGPAPSPIARAIPSEP